MKVIIPMAGRGSRLRPHTLTTPKPLIAVGGKPIVHRLVEDIARTSSEKITAIGFVIGDFGEAVGRELKALASSFGATAHLYRQGEALGTAHAVLCAEELLDGPVVIAFADTLFRADFTLHPDAEGVLWVKQIDDPSAFGVVQLSEEGTVVDFVEKPKEFVSDLAMIGVYYVKKAEALKSELRYLVAHRQTKGGEYQLPDALRRMVQKGARFQPGHVTEWLDCGNKAATVHTNRRVLELDRDRQQPLIADTAVIEDTVVVPPCFIGENAVIRRSVIGPHVAVGAETHIGDSVVVNSNIQRSAVIENATVRDSMIGNFARLVNPPQNVSIGDYTTIN